ncbi:MAG: pyridoxal-5'-phosphate-dependent protein [Maricaulis sp.]|uniref:Serine/threonine dehydratase n=1 Tax=Maricaulis virginensis TaxID=144022 RepID=A0A9W6MML5_9PROT|nr:threonine/serine dehydratase [Maricaulis virginensis]MAZ92334.1 pyridoxal-5'-phosphate-dependent protein [Maricaulis sp.]GLK51133.1 serine/threonine dehydratase [Maricaulis virginensis]
MSSPLNPPSYSDIADAAERLAGHAVRTPLLRNDVLDERTGARVFVKAECLQRTGSFKFRGAFNRISRMNADEKTRGVMAYSSGNHAQGVAAAARINGTTAKILMPADAPRSKVEGVKFWGGEVVEYDRGTQNREEMGRAIAEAEGRVLVPPYEDPFIIAGQGTAALEASEQMAEAGAVPDVVICPAGGGGLIAGTGLAMLHHHPAARVWAAEPVGFDDFRRSLASGRREINERLTGSVCDAIITPTPGELTWSINSGQLAGGAAVSDDEALAAVAFAWRHLKIVVEPGGAVALAAVLTGRVETRGKTVCVIASGGNVDRAMFARALESL